MDADLGKSHVAVQHRAVLHHLDAIRDTRRAIDAGRAVPIATGRRRSATWAAVADGAPEDARAGALRRRRPPAFRTRPVVSALVYHDIVTPGAEETSGFAGRPRWCILQSDRGTVRSHISTPFCTEPRGPRAVSSRPSMTAGIGAIAPAGHLERRGLADSFS